MNIFINIRHKNPLYVISSKHSAEAVESFQLNITSYSYISVTLLCEATILV